MFQRVMVGLDGSAFGEQVLPLAWEISRRAGAHLDLVHVVGSERASGALPAALGEARARGYLDDVLARVRAARPGSPADEGSVSTTVLAGHVVDQLLAHANTTGADLVVMATHGRGPLARAWLGSVVDKLIRRAEQPLLLVRPREVPVDLGVAVRVGRVVVPLDGSAAAERVLEPAIDLVTLWERDMWLTHVVAERSDEERVPRFERSDAAKAYLLRVWERLPLPPSEGRWKTRTIVALDIAPQILELAARPDDVIALTTRGLGGVERLLLGSVSDKVVRGADCPVLVCRARTQAGSDVVETSHGAPG